jgi:hypothetical protein
MEVNGVQHDTRIATVCTHNPPQQPFLTFMSSGRTILTSMMCNGATNICVLGDDASPVTDAEWEEYREVLSWRTSERRPTDAELDKRFASFKARRKAHYEAIGQRLLAHLQSGGIVVEHFCGADREWSAAMKLPTGTFVPEFYTPEKIAEHLLLRHRGFDTALRFFPMDADHNQDSDCAPFIRDGSCMACGVDHSATCPVCSGRGFHKSDCLEVANV